MVTAASVQKALRSAADPAKVAVCMSFFKTGPGQYGEGDQFLGVTVPKQRVIAKAHKDLSLSEIQKLLDSPWHEERLTALLILVGQFKKADVAQQASVYKFYVKNFKRVNNWDLVDSSAHYIVGPFLGDMDAGVGAQRRCAPTLIAWAQSKHLWTRRIAVIATFHFIRQDEFKLTLHLAKLLLNDPHDLMHKAVGWMLREIDKRDRSVIQAFLAEHAAQMPRTMLRYAIEKFSERERLGYLKKRR